MTSSRIAFALILAGALLLSPVPGHAQSASDSEVEYVDPDPATGISKAVVVGDVPLAHTTQMLPFDADGQLVGEGQADEQIGRVLENIRLALAEVGSGLNRLAKINVYAASNEVVQRVKEQFAQTFDGEVKPAVSFMVGGLPREEVLVAMDAVATAPQSMAAEGVSHHRADAVYGESGRGHVAVTSPAGQVYVSGQAAGSDDLLDATRGTMQSLHATLAYLGLSADDVVQVKAFINPVTDGEEVEEVIAEHYRNQPVPPIVVVEWLHPGLPTEIELIADRAEQSETSSSDDPLSFVTPPGMSSASTFSRVAEVHRGGLAYISGLYGSPSQDGEGQVRGIFSELEGLLDEVGSDFEHLVKATYYFSDEEAGNQLNEIRPEYYNPDRPPTASKVFVNGVGMEGGGITLDMIAVPVE